ncbi:MAG: MoxR family ATPase [Burkholderiales bacterium]|jgi:MoxR-like ATPase|nr:MoxR family ATPase [Burkholderiales bacterium]
MNEFEQFKQLQEFMDSRIIGQKELNKRLLIALLSSGHLLVEGAPGLAKTTAIKSLSSCIDCSYQRIQFTPDLLPADLTGTDIYIPEQQTFKFQSGPLFNNFLLADEINRAPAKVQSALLEAMGEKQITIGKTSYSLPKLFLVMATQNPIEHEGTYPLPEAQLDRFMLYVKIGYPQQEDESKILALNKNGSIEMNSNKPTLTQDTIFNAQQQIQNVYVSKAIEEYIIQLIMATRYSSKYDEQLAKLILFGASPRATIALERTARVNAWLEGRDFVTPHDIHSLVHEVLRHRIIPSFEAEVDGVTSDQIVDKILNIVAIP